VKLLQGERPTDLQIRRDAIHRQRSAAATDAAIIRQTIRYPGAWHYV